MKYAIAIWGFCTAESNLVAKAEEVASYGFDTISFLPDQITRLNAAQCRDLRLKLEELNMPVTIHGKCTLTDAELQWIVDALKGRIMNFTADNSKTIDSRGTLFDARMMADFITRLSNIISSTDIRIGVEDFPLDTISLDYYKNDYSALLKNKRLGILIDIGHMHIRRRTIDYFKQITVADYFKSVPLEIIEVHVHDNHGVKDEHGHIGFGDLNFAETAHSLRATGFDRISTLEICPPFHGSTAELSQKYIAPSLEEWRRCIDNAGNYVPAAALPEASIA